MKSQKLNYSFRDIFPSLKLLELRMYCNISPEMNNHCYFKQVKVLLQFLNDLLKFPFRHLYGDYVK